MYGRDNAKTLIDPYLLVPGLVVGLTVAALAADAGGYDSTSWGWSTIALLLVVGTSLVLGGRRLAPLEWALPGFIAALTAWVWFSLAWSADVSETVHEGERMLLYLAGTLSLLLLGRRSRVEALLVSLASAITAICFYALAVRMFDPGSGAYQVDSADPQAGFRLARPLGYANALAILAVIGILLSLGLAVRGRTLLIRALGSSALVILGPTLYFTYGRGAWLGLGAGFVALLASERGRVEALGRALAYAVAPAVAVALATRTHPLTSDPGSVAAARHDGRLLAVAIVVLAVAAAFVPVALDRLQRRIVLPPSWRRRSVLALALIAVAIVVVALASAGGPQAAVRRAYHAFNAPAPLVKTDTKKRLFSLSGSNRSDYWRVAWREAEDHPWLGGGAGSYQRFWLRHRSADLPVRDAHSLYLETLAELGPLGLALLLCALAAPLAAVGAARRSPLAAAALGAYVAFLVHAGIDWDWEMPAVTLAALVCGIALLLAARGAETRPLGRTPRAVGVGLAALLGAVALVGFAGNRAETSAADALDASHLHQAAAEARHARRWEPWSAEPWRLLGESQLQAGEVGPARASFLRGLEKDRGSWELWLDLALARRDDQRRDALTQVARLNPLSPELRQLRGSS
ncbi:MAG TPA: O-antigen ligase family protein [Gaiellaceae bacterium]|nr:O-antigen ligase family protein [Gaiellaceae bacterium]